MPIKAKKNGSYKDVTDLMNVDESIDYVLAKTSSSYKRVYTATRSIEDIPPTTFKSIKSGANLSDYRIYGNTSKNILPLSKTPKTETIGDILCEYDGKGTVTFTSAVDNPTFGDNFIVPLEEEFTFPASINSGGTGCIQINNDFSTDSYPYIFVHFANLDEEVSILEVLDSNNMLDSGYDIDDLEGHKITSLIFQNLHAIGKRTIKIQPALYLGVSTQIPFEPYGESIGDRTGNLFDGEFLQGYWAGANGRFVNANNWICTKKIPCKSNTDYTFKFTNISRWYSFAWYDTNDNYIGPQDSSTTTTTPTTFTGTSPANAAYLAIDIAGYPDYLGKISPSDVTDFMLVEGSTPLPYEPYGYKVPVKVEGKNLLQNTATSQTINGVTFTVNSDGSVTCNGIASTITYFNLNENFNSSLYAGMKASFYQSGQQPSVNSYRIRMSKADRVTLQDFIMNNQVIGDKGDSLILAIRIASGYTCNNLTFYPMIRKADISDDSYEPYQAPVTTNIYIPKKLGYVNLSSALSKNYIAFGEQKMYRALRNFFNGTLTLGGIPTSESSSTTICKTVSIGIKTGESYKINAGEYLIHQVKLKTGSVITVDDHKYSIYASPVDSSLQVSFMLPDGGEIDLDTFDISNIMINMGKEYMPYEPYHDPTVGMDITIPSIKTLAKSNHLSIGSTIKPYSIVLTGHIKEIPEVTS